MSRNEYIVYILVYSHEIAGKAFAFQKRYTNGLEKKLIKIIFIFKYKL